MVAGEGTMLLRVNQKKERRKEMVGSGNEER